MKINKCQRCNERATLYITEIEESGVEELNLCYKCAQKYLHDAEEAPVKDLANPAALTAPAAKSGGLQCPTCKITFEDFRTTGRLGCPNDYEIFRNELRPLLENVHGNLRHIGKVPRRMPADTKVHARRIQLRQELQQAVAVEDYEKAARLRDEIDQLEKQS
jgi:protein arginine kinase activator